MNNFNEGSQDEQVKKTPYCMANEQKSKESMQSVDEKSKNDNLIEFCYKKDFTKGTTSQISAALDLMCELFKKAIVVKSIEKAEKQEDDKVLKAKGGLIIMSTLKEECLKSPAYCKQRQGVNVMVAGSCKERDMKQKTAAVIDLDNPKIKQEDGSIKYEKLITTEVVMKVKQRLEELNINYIMAPSYSDKPQEDIRNVHIIIPYKEPIDIKYHKKAMKLIYTMVFQSDDEQYLSKTYGVDVALEKVAQGVYYPVVKQENVKAYYDILVTQTSKQMLNIKALIEKDVKSSKTIKEDNKQQTNNNVNNDKQSKDTLKENKQINSNDNGFGQKEEQKLMSYSPWTINKYVEAINTMPEKNVIVFITNYIQDYTYVRDEGEGKMRFKYNSSTSEAGVVVYRKESNGKTKKDNIYFWCMKSYHSSDNQSTLKGCTIMEFFVRKKFYSLEEEEQFQTNKGPKNKINYLNYLYCKGIDYLRENALMEQFGYEDWNYEDRAVSSEGQVIWSNDEIREQIHSKKNNQKKMTRENLNTIFTYSSLYKNKYAYNVLSEEAMFLKEDGSLVKIDDFENYTTNIALQNEQIYRFSDPNANNKYTKNVFYNYVKTQCKKVNPLADWFLSLEYDPKEPSLLERFLPDYLGTPDDEYHRQVLKYHLMACVKKCIYINEIFDHKYILSLFSDQNKGKTTFVRELCSVSEILEETYLGDAGVEGTEIEINSRLRGMTNIFLDEVRRPNSRTLKIIKLLVSQNELMDKRLYKNEKKVKFIGTFWAGSNTADLIVDKENKRIWPVVPFVGVDGVPTTGIFTPKWHSSKARKRLYTKLWAEAVYRVVTLKEPLYSELPVEKRKYIEQYADDLCERLKDMGYIDNTAFNLPSEKEELTFSEKCAFEVIKQLCEGKQKGDFLLLSDVQQTLQMRNIQHVNSCNINTAIKYTGWFSDPNGAIDKIRCRTSSGCRTTKYILHRE